MDNDNNEVERLLRQAQQTFLTTCFSFVQKHVLITSVIGVGVLVYILGVSSFFFKHSPVSKLNNTQATVAGIAPTPTGTLHNGMSSANNIVNNQTKTTYSIKNTTTPSLSTTPTINAISANQINSSSPQTTSSPVSGSDGAGSSSRIEQSISVTPTPTTQISIVFINPDGTEQTYTPPVTPPENIIWGSYVNAQDGYSVDYPLNWIVTKVEDSGHEGLSIFPPGSTDTSPYASHIGLGLSLYYSIPTNGDGPLYTGPVMVDGIQGTLYTKGSEGDSYVASVFPYNGGYFGLGSSVSDSTLLYVFAHMIYSLSFF